eukprot:GILK01000746.1.p1 GENE.GILK01000746.1~~GILK01000746.1.p1  ORF type:complete len:487 (-),score=62.18 GILK01000746.1:112-1572(-)
MVKTQDKRVVRSLKEKIEIVEEIMTDNEGRREKLSVRKAATKHNVDPKSIRDWRKNLDKMRQTLAMRSTVGTLKRTMHTGPPPLFANLEAELLDWVHQQRDKALPVSTTQLVQQAINRSPNFKTHYQSFDSSQRLYRLQEWCYRFMSRSKLSFRRRTKIAQKLPSELQAAEDSYLRGLNRLRQEKQFEPANIVNMDETALYFDMVEPTTIATVGEKTIHIKGTNSEKKHLTVVLSATCDGRKLAPMIIFKGEDHGRVAKELKALQDQYSKARVVLCTQHKAWMDETRMLLYVKNVLRPFYRRQLGDEKLLSMDSFSAHTVTSVTSKLQDLKFTTTVIPGGLTSRLQVMDVSVNHPFKMYYRQEYTDWMLYAAPRFTKAGFRKCPTRKEVVDMVLNAWGKIKQETISKGFKVCGFVDLDGGEDHLVGNADVLLAEEPSNSDSLTTRSSTGVELVVDDDSQEWQAEFDMAPNSDDIEVVVRNLINALQ